jgi:hypothetical protein
MGDHLAVYVVSFIIKDTTYTARFASYIDTHLEIESEGMFQTKFSKTKEIISILPSRT